MTTLSKWKKQVVGHFTDALDHYDAYSQLQEQAARKLAGFLPEETQGMDILELGCGTGNLTKQLLRKYKNASFCISDISPSLLMDTQGRMGPAPRQIEWRVMDGEALEQAGLYDLIAANMVFQWFEDLPRALEEMKAHLKPGGQILFSLPGPQTFEEWRSVLAELELPDGTLEFPDYREQALAVETQRIGYTSAHEFLRQIHKIGAHQPRKGYQPLTPAQLRRACRRFDQLHEGRIVWQIQYMRVS